MEFEEDTPLRYDAWIEQALRQVIRRALSIVGSEGLPGEHHFFITFRTENEDVVMPSHLAERYPDEMTIVLQHQFDSLEVDEDGFGVTLYFGGVPARVEVPFSAVTSFADPSVNFGLQLKTMGLDEFEDGLDMEDELMPEDLGLETTADNQDGEGKPRSDNTPTDDEKGGEVIALDSFRKK